MNSKNLVKISKLYNESSLDYELHDTWLNWPNKA